MNKGTQPKTKHQPTAEFVEKNSSNSLNIGFIYEAKENPNLALGLSQFSPLSPCYKDDEHKAIHNSLLRIGHSVEVIDGPMILLEKLQHKKKHYDLIFNKSVSFQGPEPKIYVPAI